jgi:UDP-glucose 4-epimerase
MNPKIVITGGAGFIGTHLAERLQDRGQLVLFDNLRRNSLSAVPALQQAPNVQFIQGNVLDRQQLDRSFAGASTVLHLAAIAGVSSYYNQPLDTLRVNLLGTVNVLEAAAAAGVKRLVYLSTSEVFGPDAMWVSEESPHHIGNVSDKRWVYATSKLAGEQFVMRSGEAHGISCTILRPFNVYGPRQTGEGAISNFCAAALAGQPLSVYGDGSAIRAWCYVSDFVDAVIATLGRPEAIGQDFNIGNPREVETTLGLARWVARLVPGTTIQMKEVKRAEVRGRVPVIDKARRLLQFEPKVDLAEGLRRTLDWYRSQGKA